MSKKYLDNDGLSYFWGKVNTKKQNTIDSSHKLSSDLVDDTNATNKFVTASEKSTWSGKQDALVSGTNIKSINNESLLGSGNVNLGNSKHYYGTCATANSTRAKVVVCDNFVLETGATISVLFTNAQTYNGAPYLNVNGTGNVVVQYKSGNNGVRYMWSAGEIIDFTYDGTYWVCHGRALATTTYFGVAKLSTSASSSSEAYALTPRSLYYFGNYSVCPYYSASSTYEVGDKVRYTYYIYECTTAIEEAEAWNAEHWKQIDTIQEQIDGKQDTLVSGTNIKTINNQSILGEGNITISGGGGTATDVQVNGTSITNDGVANLVTEGTYNASSNKIATMSDLPTVPTDVSAFNNDAGYISSYTETDPVFAASAAHGITSSDITSWNGKIDKNVNDLTYYYTKTEVDGKVSAVYKYKGTVSTYANLPSSGQVTGDVYNIEQADTTHGIKAGDNVAWTGSDWDVLGGEIDLSGYQTKIDSSHKLSSDLVDDTNHTNKFVTASDKTTWNAKYNKPSGGIPSTDLSSAVQTSLGKADTALQSEQYTGTITGIKMNGASKGTSGVVDLGTVITDVSGKQDKIDSSHKLSADLISDGTTNKTVTSTEKSTWNGKQNALVSGTNIKTINSTSLLSSGNLDLIPQGGRLTAPLTANGGDESNAGKIIFEQSTGGQITNTSTSTLFGFASAGDTDIKCGSTTYGLSLRGKATRPTYNGNDLALKSDVPTASVTGCIPVDANKSGFNLNTVYDASLKLFGAGTNGPKGITYGTVLTMPYRKASGNTKPDFGAQIFIPNGDDDIEHRNSLFFRSSLGSTWNEWQEISEKKPIYISTDTEITDRKIHIDDCVYDYGYGIGWFNSANNTREHIILSPYLLKGATIQYTEATWSSDYVFAISMGPSPDHDQTTDRRTNDSGWVTSSTATGTLTGEIGLGFAYNSSTKTFTTPYDGYVGINVRKANNGTISSADLITMRNWVKNNFVITGYTLPRIYRDRVDTLSPNDYNHNIKTINHRGWYECPENTLSAYRMSRYKGYKMVETDVQFTSDNVPVLLHDSSINRTARNADGSTISSTININSITFEKARTYDFGIYKGSEFAGEKIPSLQEFIILCKNLGLHPYLELKGNLTSAQIQSILNIVKGTGMKGHVTYISFELANLTAIKALDNKANLALVSDSTITQTIVNNTASLKTDYNDVALDVDYTKVNQNVADMCMNADIRLEVWTVDSFNYASSLPVYVSGFTTNSINFDKAYLSANGFYYE